MAEEVAELGGEIVGRDRELAAVRAFVAGSGGRGGALLLVGEAGIGKTTLWQAGVAAARERGVRVLATRASDTEAHLAFAGLIDLFEGVATDELAALPPPQLRALEVALLRREAEGAEPTLSGAVAFGFLNAVRTLAARGPLLVAVDDARWLDPTTAETLAFVVRRLKEERVSVLITDRPGSGPALDGAASRLVVGPLSLGAIRHLLSERLDLRLQRRLLRRLVEATLGNPLFALEIGRVLAEQGLPVGDELPIPDSVEDLLGTRIARLPPPVRRLLLAVALGDVLRVSQAEAVAAPGALDEAVDAGVLVVERERVRPAHPLLAAAAKKHARAAVRRELHRELASLATDDELRARHLALATDEPDEALAGRASGAAAAAAARGARQEAVTLAEHALRLTPAGSPLRGRRLLALGEHLAVASEPQRLMELLVPALDSLPSQLRARARLLLCQDGTYVDRREVALQLEAALAESADDAGLHAAALACISLHRSTGSIEGIAEAEALALEAAATAGASPDAERLALEALAWARSLRGSPIDDVCARYRAASVAALFVAASPERVAAQRLVWRGELDAARSLFARLAAQADERAEPVSYALVRLHRCELELRAGNWDAAERLLEEWYDPPERELLPAATYERCRALLAAGRGVPAEAERRAVEALERSGPEGLRWDRLETMRARGIAALLGHAPERAAESLRAVWRHAEREGVEEPGVFPAAPDLVEALVDSGDPEDARAVTERLGELAVRHDHPWARASARRCGGLVALASGDAEQAAAELAAAAAAYERLGLRFDAGRALLALGKGQRRARKWGAARRSLEQAAGTFEAIGSAGWLEEARSHLTRVAARRPRADGTLTAAERRVADLAASGLANKEIAAALVVSVHTVEAHLTHAYAKLGVRSRAQLARLLAGT